jgi:hypothetical protein
VTIGAKAEYDPGQSPGENFEATQFFRALRTATKPLTGPDETHNRVLFIVDFQKVLLTLIEFHLSLSGLNGPCGSLAEGFRVLTRTDELIDTHI